MGRRPDLAVRCVREAIGITATLAPGDGVKSLGGTLHSDLGDMLHAIGQDASAREAYEAALEIAEELQDLRGQAHASQRLGRILHATPSRETQTLEVTLHEDLMTDYVFETDLLVDGPRERRIIQWTGDADPPAGDVRPMLLPCTRTWTDDEGAVRFSLPMGDPIVERQPGCTVIGRIRREVAVSGISSVIWRLDQGDGRDKHGRGDPDDVSGPSGASGKRACGCGARAGRAGRHRRHRRLRTACRPVPPSGHQEGSPCRLVAWRATKSCGWRPTGTTARIRKHPGSPSANRFPIAFARSMR